MNKLNLFVFVALVFVVFASPASAQITVVDGECNVAGIRTPLADACRESRTERSSTSEDRTRYRVLMQCYEYAVAGDRLRDPADPESWQTIRHNGRRGWSAECECLWNQSVDVNGDGDTNDPEDIRPHVLDLLDADVEFTTDEGVTTRTQIYRFMCIDPRRVALGHRMGEDRLRSDLPDLTEILRRLDRLERACGTDAAPLTEAQRAEMTPAWRQLCDRVASITAISADIGTLRGQIGDLDRRLGELEPRVTDVEEALADQCGHTAAEWRSMTDAERAACIRSRSTTTVASRSPFRFHLGVDGRFLLLTGRGEVVTPNVVVYGQGEYLLGDHGGFYLRGWIGGGYLPDAPGQFNAYGTLGWQGLFGGSAGGVYRIDDRFAFDIGLAAEAAFRPGGQVGPTLHTWPWFLIGPEVRFRWNPIREFHVELGVEVGYNRLEVVESNTSGATRGIDGVGGAVHLGLGVTFGP